MPRPDNVRSRQLSEGWCRGRAGRPAAVPTRLPVTHQASQFPGGAKQPLDRTRGQQQGAKPEGYRLLQLGAPEPGGLSLALCRRALCLETGAQILRLHQCPHQFGVLRGARRSLVHSAWEAAPTAGLSGACRARSWSNRALTLWIRSAIWRQLRSRDTNSRPARPRAARRAGACNRPSMASARLPVSPFSKTTPVTPSCTISARARTLDTTTAFSIASASSGFMGETISHTGHGLRGNGQISIRE